MSRYHIRAGEPITWLTLPAEPVTPSKYTVWIESMIAARGRIASISCKISCAERTSLK